MEKGVAEDETVRWHHQLNGSSQVALVVKNLPAIAGDLRDTDWILGQEDLLEKSMAVHSSIIAWRIPWTDGAWQTTVHRVAKSWT